MMKFYKILNEEENHFGLQYKIGLNSDSKPFSPSGNCKKGGIYFAREDILAFLDYGPWLREVILPPDAKVYENPGFPKKWKANEVVLGEREKINTGVIKRLIEEGADVHTYDDLALRWASRRGYYDIVKLLITHKADVHACAEAPLIGASESGHYNVVKLLIKHGADVHACGGEALMWAFESGHHNIVKLLIKHGGGV